MDEVHSVLRGAGTPWKRWGEALNHEANAHNCTVSSALDEITPHEALLGKKPDNSKFRIFGCAAYVHVAKKARDSKFDDHAQ